MLVSQGADRQKNTWTPIFLGWGLPSIIVLTLIGDHKGNLARDAWVETHGPKAAIVYNPLYRRVMISSNDNDVN